MNVDVTAVPLYFPSGSEQLFGWLHEPGQGQASRDTGLVICKPFGYEAICSHRSLRAFADASAALGIPVLRFDYAGTGDSSGGESQGDQIHQWSLDVVAAVEALKRKCGVTRVCLLGVRLGALLAMLAAAANTGVAVIAIAPVVSGRRYLRELRAFQGTAAPNAAAAPLGGALEVTGFTLSEASVASLGGMDLTTMSAGSVREILILDRDDLPQAKSWAEALSKLGIATDYRALPGFTEMVSTPHAARIPQEMIAATVEWLGRQPGAHPRVEAAPPELPEASMNLLEASMSLSATWMSASAPAMRLPVSDGEPLTEQALFIDGQGTLFAIVTRATGSLADRSKPRHGVVLLNGGATNHIGPNRMYVSLARRWAARGYVVLRLDLAGLGDSATRPLRPDNEVYPSGALDDIAAAIDFLRRRYRVEDVTLAGLCAGAYHALRAATAGLPVKCALMINPLTFFWKQGMTLNDLQIAEVVRNPGVYAEHMLSGKYWLKLLRGRVNLWRVAMVLIRRAWLTLDANLRDLKRWLHFELTDDLGQELAAVAGRGVRLVFLFARGEPGPDLLKIQGGSVVKTLGDRCRIYTIDGADHIFSQSEPRAYLEELLSGELPQ